MREFRHGRLVAVVSDQTLQELEKAPGEVRGIVASIPDDHVVFVELDDEARILAREYVRDGAISQRHLVDAQHIAMATINRVDFLASWNFKEMVNVYRIRKYNSVNLKHGYSMIDIRTPKELLYAR